MAPGPAPQYELLADHHSEHGPTVVQVRGSLIASSLATLRTNNLFDRYLEHLPTEQHDNVLFVLAASWVPIEVAMAHYGACDAMQLNEAELEAMGRSVSEKLVGTLLGTLVRTARLLIAPKSMPLRQYPKLWDRLLMGGGCRISMLGDNEARIESHGVPMFRFRYFRVAYAALVRGAGLMFQPTLQARIRKATDDSLTIDLTWVQKAK
jgi:hypothetical protein